MDEQKYYLGFSNFSGIGSVRFKKLIAVFGSAKSAWNADQQSIKKAVGEITSQKLQDFKQTFSIEKYVEKLKLAKVQFIPQIDKRYPKLLKQISNPPIGLYVKGNIDVIASEQGLRGDLSKKIASSQASHNDAKTIAVVGTRKITNYGREVTQILVGDLVLADFIIVSGLAIGVDACAHQSTLDSKGKTIAVLGCGVDCCYPSSNQVLYNSILEQDGLIVSEFPLSQKPSIGSFPSRNRIIAGLSQAVLVTEGAADSGSLITAELALKFGRKVFAIPGPITSSLSVGPYKLLKSGAVLVSSASEIIKELGGEQKVISNKQKVISSDDPQEQKIIALLQNETMHFDEIVRSLKLSPDVVGSLLTLMEIKGIIKNLEGGNFSLSG